MNDLDLIQRFRAEVPAPGDERAHAARARLVAEVRAADARTEGRRDRGGRGRHRLRPALALRVGVPAAASVAAAAAVAIVLLGGGVSGSGTSTADAAIIHHAGAVFAPPPNEIFHSKLQGDGFVVESWQLTSAPYSFVGGKGPIGAVGYVSSNGTTVAYYDPATDTIHQTRTTKPSTKPTAPDNPLTEVQQNLRDGRARVLGKATVDDTASYEIQFADNGGFDAQSLIAYVDQSSYRPIEIADPQRDGTIVHLRVVAFEYLPATPANMRLLSLSARYPRARVVSDHPNGGSAPQETAQQTRTRVADGLSFARCMRSHGVTRFPDPTAQGDLSVEMVQAQGIDLHSPAVLRVVQACLPASHGALTAAKVRAALNNAGG